MTELMAITLLMGLFLVAVAAALPRLSARRSGVLATTRAGTIAGGAHQGEGPFTKLERSITGLVDSQRAWLLGFLLLAATLTAGAILFAGGEGIPEEFLGPIGIVVAAVLGLLVLGYIVVGSFLAVTGRGRSNAEAALAAFVVFGALLTIAIATRLLI